MIVKKSSFYSFLIFSVLLLQLYLPSFKLNVFIQLFLLLFCICLEKQFVKIRFIKSIMPLIIVLCIGCLGCMLSDVLWLNVIKDIFHFIKPIIGILLGYMLISKINSTCTFAKTIIVAGFISACIHVIILFTMTNIFSGDVASIRTYSRDNFLELFSLLFLVFYKSFYKRTLFSNKKIHITIFLILVFSIFFYLSRTMIVVFLVLLFSILGYTIINKKTVLFLGLFFTSVSLFYVYLYSIKIERGQTGINGFLYKIKVAPEEIFKHKINREDHQDLWDHWRGYEAKRALDLMNKNPSSYVIGTGYGSMVNLKFKAPLTEDPDVGLKYISELHNGYMYILYKTGVLGLLFILLWLFYLYWYIYKTTTKFISRFISGIGLSYLFTTLTITGIYNNRDIMIILLGGLFFLHFKNEKEFV